MRSTAFPAGQNEPQRKGEEKKCTGGGGKVGKEKKFPAKERFRPEKLFQGAMEGRSEKGLKKGNSGQGGGWEEKRKGSNAPEWKHWKVVPKRFRRIGGQGKGHAPERRGIFEHTPGLLLKNRGEKRLRGGGV